MRRSVEPRSASLPPTVAWVDSRVRLVDQTALPDTLRVVELTDWREVMEAIQTMVVRGAPAIGCAAALGMALAARELSGHSPAEFAAGLRAAGEQMKQARPTAVNLSWAVDRILAAVEHTETPRDAALLAERTAVTMLEEDLETNRRIGRFGAALLRSGDSVLTHCNAGALCAVGYGTALGVVRSAVEEGKRIQVYAGETRPRLQGMKLTAWELQQDGIPVTLIADSMAAALMRQGKVDAVVVGADRIAANGDAANKIGTYALAVLARHHGIPFYVAAPLSTVDLSLPHGDAIPIEARDASEMTHISGMRVAPENVPVLNPAFDVTPAELITSLVTERGALYPPFGPALREAVGAKGNASLSSHV